MLDEKLGIMLKIKKRQRDLVELLFMGFSTASLAFKRCLMEEPNLNLILSIVSVYICFQSYMMHFQSQ